MVAKRHTNLIGLREAPFCYLRVERISTDTVRVTDLPFKPDKLQSLAYSEL
jgi:hypothetical protein